MRLTLCRPLTLADADRKRRAANAFSEKRSPHFKGQ
jgi:hypothetical protein